MWILTQEDWGGPETGFSSDTCSQMMLGPHFRAVGLWSCPILQDAVLPVRLCSSKVLFPPDSFLLNLPDGQEHHSP